VIVELTRAGSRQPKVMHLMGAAGAYHRTELPEFHDGIAQLIVEGASEIITAIQDPDTEVFLK
ncbi:MAG: hypothetical protein HOH61_13240, partial [Rhodospirillaceae bacterium]|nr:hypothetical protein [Rhodospirillaceae bacterium]